MGEGESLEYGGMEFQEGEQPVQRPCSGMKLAYLRSEKQVSVAGVYRTGGES